MATSSTTPKNRNRFKLLSVFLLSLFCLFLFIKRAFESKPLFYGDLISLTPAPLLLLSPPSRSTQFHENVDGLRLTQPAVSSHVFDPVGDNVGGDITASSKLSELEVKETAPPAVSSEPEFEDDSGEITGEPASVDDDSAVPISSKSDLGDKNAVKTTAPLVSSEPDSGNDSGEITGEPVSVDDDSTLPISSKSDLDDKNAPDDTTSPEFDSGDDSGEITGDPVLLDDDSTLPVSSKSDLGDETRAKPGIFIDTAVMEKLRNCDVYKGKWVRDDGYPHYKPGSCPYVDDGFDCQGNGRPDSDYLKWRWQPDDCDLPRFNATDFLVRLRGKRLMLVGDSMNRNQFESLLCLLREGLPDKSKMYEVHGYKITKGRGYYVFKIEDYDCTVEFIRSHFLVREGIRINAQGNSNPTLSIDRIDKTARRWLRADILVFNTAHWWTHGKTSKGKNYYKEGDFIYPKFDAVEAYRRAIKTWAAWIKRNIKKDKLVFYRGYSSAHFRGGDWDSGGSCNGEKEPVIRGPIIDSYPEKMRIVEQVLRETKVPVVLLNVTRLTNYRKDGHPSVYGKNVTRLKKVSTRRQDCSHWCLPGVPDAWNELIYSSLVATQTS
ncbi:hypothetical protein ABFS83_10G142500 [Erythranthe nasuta]